MRGIWILMRMVPRDTHPYCIKCFKIGHLEHNDVIKWKYFPCYRPFVRGIHRGPVDSPHRLWNESAGQCVYTQCWSVLASAEHCIGAIFIDFIDLIRLPCWPVRVQICKWGFHFPVLTRALCSADQCGPVHFPVLSNVDQCWAVRVQMCKWGFQCWPVSTTYHCRACYEVLTSVICTCSPVLASAFPSTGQCVPQCWTMH